MKRILVLNYEFPPLGGGASPVGYEIAKRLSETGEFSIDVVTMRFKGLPKVEEINQNLKIHRVSCLRTKKEICYFWEQVTYLVAGFFKCVSLHRKNRYAICHTHFVIPTGALAFMLKSIFGLQYIITSHGSDIPGYNTDRFKLLHKILRVPTRIFANGATQLIAGSRYLADMGNKNLCPRKPYTVIREGFDIHKFVPQTKKNYIFASGRLLERKGFQDLIKAVSDKDYKFEVHIAGDGPMMPVLKELASSSKTKVVLHGWIDRHGKEFKDLLEQAAIFCLPSAKENSSVSLFEGMAGGCAVITTNVSGCPESIGDAGLLVSPHNVEDIREKISQLVDNPQLCWELGAKARKRITDIYGWQKPITGYAVLLR